MRLRLELIVVVLALATSSCAWIARASVDSNGVQGNGDSSSPALSADGRYVALVSSASNLVPGDTDGQPDVFVRDLRTGSTSLVSVDSSPSVLFGNEVAISGDGQRVAFASSGEVVVHDLPTRTNTRVDIGYGFGVSMSADGRFVAFVSVDDDLVPGDDNGVSDAFVHDTSTGTTTRVSVDSDGDMADDFILSTSISADGRHLAVETHSDIDESASEIFVRDLVAGTTTRVDVGPSGAPANGFSASPSISADGRYVAFQSTASNLVAGDTNRRSDVFVRDSVAGTTTRVSLGPNGQQGNLRSASPSISADGTRVAFTTYSTWFGLPIREQVYVRDTTTATTTRVSTDSLGSAGNDDSYEPSISPDGRFVAFATDATNLVANDTNGAGDVIVRAVDTPSFDTVTPDTLAAGTTTNVTITGTGFGPGTTVATFVTNPDGVTVDALTVVSPTELQLTVTVDPTATPGRRNLYLQVPGPGPGEGGMTASLDYFPDCLTITP